MHRLAKLPTRYYDVVSVFEKLSGLTATEIDLLRSLPT